MATLDIGAFSRQDGYYQIADTRPDGNTLFVTVREMYGLSMIGPQMLESMRRLARRAVEQPRSAKTVRTFYAEGCSWATFAVTS